MRRAFILPFLLITFALSPALPGAEFRMNNGSVLTGDLASADEDGIVVKLEAGALTKREPWVNFSQETLKELGKDPKMQPLVEPFIEVTLAELDAKQKKKDIVVRPVPSRLERPAQRPGFFAAFFSPIGLLLLVGILGANLYAAYEIALYRDRPVALVCLVSLLLPGLGPVLFLSLPGAAPAEPVDEAASETAAAAAVSSMSSNPNMPKSALSLAAADKAAAASAGTQPQVFSRGEYTFNRRFIETKFSGFFRLVPTDAEKDLVVVIKGVKQEYIGKRITRISSNELHLQLLNGNQEAMVTFAEIQSITIRHKDTRA